MNSPVPSNKWILEFNSFSIIVTDSLSPIYMEHEISMSESLSLRSSTYHYLKHKHCGMLLNAFEIQVNFMLTSVPEQVQLLDKKPLLSEPKS